MTKINRSIVYIKDILGKYDNEIKIDSKKTIRKTYKLYELISSNLTDFRVPFLVKYPLADLVMLVFLGILCGGENYNDILFICKKNKKVITKIIPNFNEFPSHDTLNRAFKNLNSAELSKICLDFIEDNIKNIKKRLKPTGVKTVRQIAVDGKAMRGSGRLQNTYDKIRPKQILNVYDISYGIVLESIAIDDKTNEIPVAQRLLKNLDLKDSIVSFDAMNTQKDTIKIIRESRGDYIGALKGNQHSIFNDVSTYFTDDKTKKIKETNRYLKTEIEKAHNQIEIREYFLINAKKFYQETEWKDVNSIVLLQKKTIQLHQKIDGEKHEEKTEKRYYITSLKEINLIAEAIRNHWSIENNLHWHLDVAYNEDDIKIIDSTSLNNISILNKLALLLTKLSIPLQDIKNLSVKTARKGFGWNLEESLGEVFQAYDDKQLLDFLKENITQYYK